MSKYLGDFVEDSSHYFVWDSNGGDGASITRSTDGTVTVWKEGDSTAASVAGVTDDEDEGTNVGVHRCSLVLTDAFYEKGKDYTVVLLAATIDGKVVNAVLAEFSVENRFEEVTLADGAQGGASMVLTFERFVGSSAHADGTVRLDNTAGAGLHIESSKVAGHAVHIQETGLGASHAFWCKSDGDDPNASGAFLDGVIGLTATGVNAGLYALGSDGTGLLAQGSTGEPGLVCMSGIQVVPAGDHAISLLPSTNGHALYAPGNGTGSGIYAVGGDTGHGIVALGGATSGDGFHGEAQTLGDGMELVGAGGGYDLNADIQGNLSGSAGSVTGAVGSVTGAVGSVTGAVGSVTGAVGSVAGNVDGSVGSVVGAVGSVTGAVGSVAGNVDGNVTGNLGGNVNGNVSGSVGSVTGAVGSVTGAVGSVTGGVGGDLAGDVQGKVLGGGAGVIAGDGVQASSVTGAVGSVTGAVGSVAGAVGSVTGNVGGDLLGKVIGGGVGVITGDGVRASSVTGAVGSVTGAVGSVTGAVGSVVANVTIDAASKTGHALAATGLDTIPITEPAGVASSFPEMVVQTWRRFFKKSVLTPAELKTYADDGIAVLTTQDALDVAGTQTLGDAS